LFFFVAVCFIVFSLQVDFPDRLTILGKLFHF